MGQRFQCRKKVFTSYVEMSVNALRACLDLHSGKMDPRVTHPTDFSETESLLVVSRPWLSEMKFLLEDIFQSWNKLKFWTQFYFLCKTDVAVSNVLKRKLFPCRAHNKVTCFSIFSFSRENSVVNKKFWSNEYYYYVSLCNNYHAL